MHLFRMTILKVKGVSPDRISAIHAEVERLNNKAATEALLSEHPIMGAIKAKLEAECHIRAENWKRTELELVARGYRAIEAMTAPPDTKDNCRRTQDERKDRLEKFQSVATVSVVLRGLKENPVEILKSGLSDSGDYRYYGLEIQIQAGFAVEVDAKFSISDNAGGPPIERITKPRDFELIPGGYLYGRLFELLGIRPADGEPDLSKFLVPAPPPR